MYCKLGLPVRLTGQVTKGSGRHQLGIREGSPQTDSLAVDTALAEDTTEEGDWRRDALLAVKAIKDAKTRTSLYHDSYPLWKHPTDGRIHPQIKNCGTVTRRPSGTSPNILQVSKHQQEGVMRSIYIPYEEDEVIVSIDFSQQELRIMASESGDENLISCYVGENIRDVHSLTASGIAKIDYQKYIEAYADENSPIHKEMVNIRKRPAKQTNFLVAYLGEAFTLSRRLIIPFEEADKMMNAAYSTYPKVQPWQQEVIKFAMQHGYSLTAYGNRRHANQDLFSSDSQAKSRMQRQVVNAVIQGTAADILKIVLTESWLTNLWVETGATLIAPVYDEMTSSVPVSSLVEYIDRMVAIMEVTPPNHIVPMVADVSLGVNWRDQIEIGTNPTAGRIEGAVDAAVESAATGAS
jgi:DNA polymerase I-like protein with 3'-5' exonuclease and polymerase domains